MNSAPTPLHAVLPFFFPVFFIAWFFVVSFLMNWASGWRLLAQRFRATEPFCGETWNWQSARFRRWCNYNNCLTFGANQQTLYLSITPLFRLFCPFSPPLSIPWSEIEVQTGKLFFGWYDTATFRLGSGERVSVRVYGKLVNRLRQTAGPGWPLYHQEQTLAPSFE